MLDFLFGTLCLLIVFCGLSACVGAIAFDPVRRLGELQRAPWQFRMCDFLVLVALLQVVVAVSLAVLPPSASRERFAVVGFLGIVMAAWWLGGVRLLSKARIERLWPRVVFLGVAIPLICVLTLVFLAAPFVLLVQIAAAVDSRGKV